jgi:hypothetical protein
MANQSCETRAERKPTSDDESGGSIIAGVPKGMVKLSMPLVVS